MYIIETNPLEQFQKNLHDTALAVREGRESKRKRQRAQELIARLSPEDQAVFGGFEDPEKLSEALGRAKSAEDLAAFKNALGFNTITYKTDEDIRKEKAKNRNPFEKFTLEGEAEPQSVKERESAVKQLEYTGNKGVDLQNAKELKQFSTQQDIEKVKQVEPIKYKYKEKLKKTTPGKNLNPIKKTGTLDFMGSLDSNLNELMRY